MTSIEQIEISGVRSFDPNPNNRQRIVFKKPLTVILGKNGAGKTTIIEALLNACTGQMPPGGGTEKSSFVYDPKVVGENDVKAQIRLLFTGRGGKVMQVIRSFQATRTRNKTTFATLDNIVAFQDSATGKIISSTYRANDVDRAIPDMLGVSPAVLEHVIFCHQEDGNWPLSPPKEVKKIFDDIFAATRYVLALDRLRENNKELRRQQKEHEASLMSLSEHREQARQISADITVKEETVAGIKAKTDALAPQLQELQAIATALDNVEHRAEGLSREAAVIEGRIGEKRESLSRLNVSPPGYSLGELLQRRQNFGEKLRELESTVSTKKELMERAVAELRRCEESVVSLRSGIEFREKQEQQHKRECEELKVIMSDLSMKFVIDGEINEHCLTKITEYVNEELHNEEQKRSGELNSIDAGIRAVEDRRSTTLRAMDTEGKEKEMKEEQLRHLMKRCGDAKEALGKLAPYVTPTRLKNVQDTITELEKRVEAMELLQKGDARYRQRQDILQSVEAQNKVVAQLRQELSRHKQRSGREAEMNLLRTQIAEKEEIINNRLQEELIAGLNDLGCNTGGSQTLTTVTMQIDKLRRKMADTLYSVEAEVNDLDRQLIALKQNRSQLEGKIVSENIELQRKRVQCISKLGNDDALTNFEALLVEARDRYHKLNEKLSGSKALAACHAHFVEQAKVEDKCPLCGRAFGSENELNDFLASFKVGQQTSGKDSIKEGDVEKALQRVRGLEQLESDVMDVRRLADNAPQLEESLKSTIKQIRDKEILLEDVHNKRDKVKDEMQRAQKLVQAAMEVNAMTSEKQALLQQLNRREAACAEASTSSANIGGAGEPCCAGELASLSYEELSDKYESANAELHRLNVLLSEMQRGEEGGSAQALVKELTMKRSELCELKMKLTRQAEVEATIAQYAEQEEGYVSRIAEIDDQREKLVAQLESYNKELEALHAKRKELELASQQGYIGQLKRTLGLLSAVLPRLRDYITSRVGEELSRDRESLCVNEKRRDTQAEEVKLLRLSIDDTLRIINEEQRLRVEVDKYIEYLEKKGSIEEDEKRLSDVRCTLSELKVNAVPAAEAVLGKDVVERESVGRIRELIRGKISALECLRAQQDGVAEAMRQDIESLKGQLTRDKYKDIEKRYRTTFLKVQTTEIAVSDVEKYYRALEKAVQTYHQEKIAQINQILADLWRHTYKGSDIDTIELRSEDDVTSTTARRSYSYRVVMKRGNSEMDMRGRCSAGQKVLASVLIRLALSEAFCCDCGILALDEPTTNLDEDNARSLAESLRMLIDSHRAVKHFQLIVITHDEHFVRALGGQALDTFYYIHKDREGAFSVIEERTFDQLFAS
ncbi:RAD50 DNA repair-like protein [Trypanosoma equiperdum]|uniref:DNA repair protein RAD50 n=1 Tax=Trypanosoma equiperdum TaxID=5694 RepID=A0A1G4IFN0_TRYEQ|nr:RAD50 DNA repair-like protein [Trypanosoma equiperdum]